MSNAAKVGGLLLVFFALLFGTYAALGSSLFREKADRYSALMPDATGIVPGTRVLLAGVPVGKVETVDLVSATEARVTLAVKPKTPLPVGTEAVVPGSLIGLGDTPLSLVPPPGASGVLPPGSTLRGRKQGPLDSFLPDSKKTLAEVDRILVAVRKLLEDQKLKRDVQTLLVSSNATIQKFGALAGRMDALMADNRAEIALAIRSGTRAVADVQRITAQVAILLEKGSLQRDAQGILANVRSITKRADSLVAKMDRLAGDPSIGKIAANVAEVTETSKAIAKNVQGLTERSGGIADDVSLIAKNGVQISANVADVTAQAKEVVAGATDIEERVKGLLDRLGGVLGKGAGGGPKLPPIDAGIDVLRESEPGRVRTDFNAVVPVSGGRVHFGLFDAFDTNRLNLQWGKDLTPSLAYRYGIYGSKAGIGVDYRLSPRISLRNDLWDVNELRYDARLNLDFGNGFYGWAGVERVFGSNSPIFGIGFRR